MADETNTTETQNSQTKTQPSADDAGGSGTEGSQDAGKSAGSDAEADADSSLLGDAGADSGTGDAGADEKAADGGEDAGDGETGEKGPPEAYELNTTVKDAEGKDVAVEVDPELLAKATPLFKELGLTNEQANKIAPLAIDIQNQVVAKQNDDFAAMRTQWAKDAKADPDIGGKNWDSTISLAAKALDHFGAKSNIQDVDGQKVETNDFRVLLNDTGLGNHPVMLKIFRSIGQSIAEDTKLEGGDANPATKKSREEIMYPEDAPKK